MNINEFVTILPSLLKPFFYRSVLHMFTEVVTCHIYGFTHLEEPRPEPVPNPVFESLPLGRRRGIREIGCRDEDTAVFVPGVNYVGKHIEGPVAYFHGTKVVNKQYFRFSEGAEQRFFRDFRVIERIA